MYNKNISTKGYKMRKTIIAGIILGLLPIIATPAEAKVCSYKSRQYKNTSSKGYTYYYYKTSRVCR
jgi:hypothetical protein